MEYFQKRCKGGAGGVTISAQIGYLHEVLKTARGLWHLDVPVSVVKTAKYRSPLPGWLRSHARATVADQ